MRFVSEFRDGEKAKRLVQSINALATFDCTIMEICGGQTHTILRYGIDTLLQRNITLVHGPGCPVCVTSPQLIDQAQQVARQPGVIFCSYGDMLRVPGSDGDLLAARADGADIRVVYSPLDALEVAIRNPGAQVVFFSIGFETTAPMSAMTLLKARRLGVSNFSIICAHYLVMPAMEAILDSDRSVIDGFLAAGHVCTITGYHGYQRLSERYGVPIVVTGFEPVDILLGIEACLRCLAEDKPLVVNRYARSVKADGNRQALNAINRVFSVTDRSWRGIGLIPDSGLQLREEFARFDALDRFDLDKKTNEIKSGCIAGEVLMGIKKPVECSLFGVKCDPRNPLGAPMVSAEGACAAYFKYKKR